MNLAALPATDLLPTDRAVTGRPPSAPPLPRVRRAPVSLPPPEGGPVEMVVPATPTALQPMLELFGSPEPVLLVEDPSPWPLPDAARWSAALGRTVLEVATGRRPPSQLARWLTPDAAETLLARLPRHRGRPSAGPPPVVLSVRVQHPADGVAEVTLHGRVSGGSVALALRLAVRPGGWVATRVELGPVRG